jgi:hypothetical protein
MEAAIGFEPMNGGFADLSLNHLGTPPCDCGQFILPKLLGTGKPVCDALADQSSPHSLTSGLLGASTIHRRHPNKSDQR